MMGSIVNLASPITVCDEQIVSRGSFEFVVQGAQVLLGVESFEPASNTVGYFSPLGNIT